MDEEKRKQKLVERDVRIRIRNSSLFTLAALFLGILILVLTYVFSHDWVRSVVVAALSVALIALIAPWLLAKPHHQKNQ